jgi:DNA invertase Pin-like site-specific DNA recombinase
MTGAFAEFERSMIRQRVNAGLKRAVAQDKRLGRPGGEPEKLEKARREFAKGTGILKTAKLVGLGTGTVHKLKREMVATA